MMAVRCKKILIIKNVASREVARGGGRRRRGMVGEGCDLRVTRWWLMGYYALLIGWVYNPIGAIVYLYIVLRIVSCS